MSNFDCHKLHCLNLFVGARLPDAFRFEKGYRPTSLFSIHALNIRQLLLFLLPNKFFRFHFKFLLRFFSSELFYGATEIAKCIELNFMI